MRRAIAGVSLAVLVMFAEPSGASASLTFLRPDGSRLRLERQVTVTCDGFGDPALFVVGGREGRRSPSWLLAIPRRLVGPGSYALPIRRSSLFGTALILFDGRDRRQYSSIEGGADGRLVVHSASCSPRPRIAVSIYGHLGSGAGRRNRVLVYGSFRDVGSA